MPVTFSPIITDLGQSVFVPLATGIEFTFTHVAVGTGTSAVNSTATALENEIARFPIAGGGINSGGKSASINALITNHTNANPQNYNISEIGFFGLDASSNTVLFAIYRQGTTIINKVAGVDIAIPFSLGLGALPASNITVQLDTNISAMMALLGQHTSLNHPHTQYKRTLNNTERLKIADGVDNDEAISKGQLDTEATTRAGVDSALAGQIAQEVLDRENAVAQVNFAIFDSELTYNTTGTHVFTVPPNVSRVLVELQAAGGGGGQGGGNDRGSEIGGGGGGGAAGQWVSVLLFNLTAGMTIDIVVGEKGLGGHSGSINATHGGSSTCSMNGVVIATAFGGLAGAKGAPGNDDGANPSYQGTGGAIHGVNYLYARFCMRIADVYEEKGMGGGVQTIHGGRGGNAYISLGGVGGTGYTGITATAGGHGSNGSGGGGGGGQTGSGGAVGGNGGDGFVKVYW